MRLLIILCLLLFNQSICRLTEKSQYDYSSYSAVKKNEDLSEQTITSTNSDESAVYIDESATITKSNIIKESGESSKIEDSEFYGVNAAVLVQGGTLTMTGGEITTKAKGANALVATNEGTVTISGTSIISTATGSGRGLHATYGGKINGKSVTITTSGQSCAALATDRGEGEVTCNECSLTTNGKGSPIIYSTGNIKVESSEGSANGAQAVVIEGKNTAEIKACHEFKCTATPNRNDVDQCGVMIYQSMSGDASPGLGKFICTDSEIRIIETSPYYKTAPMFFVTNTHASIELTNCRFYYGSNTFLSVKATNEWGRIGQNGGNATLYITNQYIEGNLEVDGNSYLTIKFIKSSIKGAINPNGTAKVLAIDIDKDSKITLTGNSYYTSFVNELQDGSNLINGSYSWSKSGENKNSAKIIQNLFWILLFLNILLL